MSELFTTVTGHPRLSLCMIVRNEAMQLERCLRSIAAWVDEIVVVDTGSEDETPEIAIKFGAKVLNFEWRDDFAVARNFSLANATGDWIIFLDADEELAQGSGTILRQAINAPKKEGFLCQLICLSSLHDQRSANILQALRIFRHRTHYHFSGRVHEQIIDSILKIHPNESIVFTPIVIKHHGYLPEVRKQKKKDERNLKLLLMELEEADASPEIYYYLGSEYNASEETLHALEYYLKAEAINRSSPFSQISILIARNIPLCLYALGRYPEVIERVTNSLSQYLKYTDLLFYRANAWLHLKNPVKAGCDFVTCLKLGDAGYPYPASTGCGSFLVWRPLGDFYRMHGNRRLAKKAYLESLYNNPWLAATWRQLYQLFMAGSDPWREWKVFHRFGMDFRKLDISARLTAVENLSGLADWDWIRDLLLSDEAEIPPEDYSRYYFTVGCSYFFERRWEEAFQCFERIPATESGAYDRQINYFRKLKALVTGAYESRSAPNQTLRENSFAELLFDHLYQFFCEGREFREEIMNESFLQQLVEVVKNLALLREDRLLGMLGPAIVPKVALPWKNEIIIRLISHNYHILAGELLKFYHPPAIEDPRQARDYCWFRARLALKECGGPDALAAFREALAAGLTELWLYSAAIEELMARVHETIRHAGIIYPEFQSILTIGRSFQ